MSRRLLIRNRNVQKELVMQFVLYCGSARTRKARPTRANGDTRSLTSRSGNEKRARRWCSALSVGCALALGCAIAPPTKAGAIANFTENYALTEFTLANINIQPDASPNGTAISPDGGLSVVLTGGLSGSGNLGESDLFIDAAGTGLVQFGWSFSNGLPGFISGGYLLGATSTASCAACITLSDSSGSGDVMFAVTQTEVFGFFVITDNQANPISGEPGALTITDFSAPSGSSNVPEPGTAAMFIVAGVAGTAQTLRSRLDRRREESL
jgi:hypothetical protein